MLYLEQFEDVYQDYEIAILGGGENLPYDIFKVYAENKNIMLLGINYHSIILPQLDFILYLDARDSKSGVDDYCLKHPGTILSMQKQDLREHDIYIGRAKMFGFSGTLGTWICDYMGFKKIYICGIDLYTGKKEHWHRPPTDKMSKWNAAPSLDAHRKVRDALKHPDRIKAVSGPLMEVYK